MSKITYYVRNFRAQMSGCRFHRYYSQDICRRYFLKNRDTLTRQMELSCLHLAAYLASWGMYRGSSILLERNFLFYEKVIEYIESINHWAWGIDVCSYVSEGVLDKLLQIYNDLELLLGSEGSPSTDTRVSKVMAGVWGSVPAFDRYVKSSLLKDGYGVQGKCFCGKIASVLSFYNDNKREVDYLHKIYKCNRVKIIDMYGFQRGLEEDRKS